MADAANGHGRDGIHVLTGLWAALAVCTAVADEPPSATITAELYEDGRIRGRLSLSPAIATTPGLQLLDPLAALPSAPDDLNQLRTFPGPVDRGSMRFENVGPGAWTFESQLPRRFGAIGHTQHGTYASGGFYPQPVLDGRIPELSWTVDLTLPDGALGVVGNTVGTGVVHWEGASDRVTLAVPRKARVETVEVGSQHVTVVGKRRPRRALLRAVEKVLPETRIDGKALSDTVLVEAPLRRRLVRPSAGVALVSDRIFRLAPLFTPFHRHGFVKGIATAASPHRDGLARELDGAVRAAQWKAERRGGGASGLTRAFTWVPQIDYLLSSRRIAFYSEIFEEVHPGDVVQDDLVETLAPRRPGSSVRVQLDDRYGVGTSEAVNQALHRGLSLPEALAAVDADPDLDRVWRRPLPVQDYVLTVGDTAVVTRQTAPDAPLETVILRTTTRGETRDRAVRLLPGQPFDLGPVERVVIDPRRHVLQASRTRDAWPQRPLRVTAAAFVNNLNLTRFRIEGSAIAWLRGRYDTKNLFSGSVFSSRSSLVGGSLGYVRKFGPLIDGISRQHRLSFSVGPRVIDPRFLSVEDGRFSVAGSARYSWDNRVSSDFPLRGQRISIGGTAGTFPGTSSRWANASAAATAITSPHPRHAFAARARVSVAAASRPDQLITLGGLGSMRSLPVLPPCQLGPQEDPCAQVAREAVLGAVEYRVAPLRNLSVPMGLIWGTELQVSVGLEGVAARLLEGNGAALGGTLAVGGLADMFGAEPTFMGVTGGWLLYAQGIDYAEPLDPVPEIYLLWTQAF